MINTHYLKLPLSRTSFHGPKGVRVIEVLLYIAKDLFQLGASPLNEISDLKTDDLPPQR